jgi:hypothetical protein
MSIAFTPTPGTLNKFKRTASQFQHQATFQNPHKNLAPFVEAILSALHPLQSIQVTIHEIIFEPRNVNALLEGQGLSPLEMHRTDQWNDWSLIASENLEIRDLLVAVLSDSIDFTLIPMPRKFLSYADHDDYVTFFAATKSNLNRVVSALEQLKLRPNDYQRRL